MFQQLSLRNIAPNTFTVVLNVIYDNNACDNNDDLQYFVHAHK